MVTRKLILVFLLFVFFSWFVCMPAAAVDYGDFPSELQSILDERIADLEAQGGICIAGVVAKSDDAWIRGGKDVQVNLLHRGDEPLRIYGGGWFIMKRTRKSSNAGTGKRLILRAFGYEPIDAFITILDGKMTYLDFEMSKTASENLASVKGVVVDEGDYLFPGAHVSLTFPYANYGISATPIMDMYTNTNGEYLFSDLSACEYGLTASASGYAYHTEKFTPSIGEVTERDRILYPNRRIVIDYVYQADGSRSFIEGDLKTGTIDWLCAKDGVDFSKGQIEGHDKDDSRDLDLRQVQDVLKFRNFYCNGENGFYDAGLVDFNSVTEARKEGYEAAEKPCLVDHVYVVKTYELKYAKFIVKTNESSFRTVSPEDLAVMKFPTYGLTIDFSECNDYGQVYVRKYYNPHKGLVGVALPYYWEISGLDDLRYSADLTVSYNEDELLNLGISENSLALLYRASYNADWDRLEAKTDTANNTLEVEGITSFGLFAIVAEQTVEE